MTTRRLGVLVTFINSLCLNAFRHHAMLPRRQFQCVRNLGINVTYLPIVQTHGGKPTSTTHPGSRFIPSSRQK
jgi:hypothetical protein